MTSVKVDLNGKVNALSSKRGLAGVLFDKDGTLIDFQLTWGPAMHAVMHALAAGNADKLDAQAELLHFDLEARAFLSTSPLIGGATAQYGMAWAGALGRTDFAALRAEIDALSAEACFESLTAIGEPAEVLRALKQTGVAVGLATNDSEHSARRHLDKLGLTELMDFIAGYDSGHGAKPAPGMVEAFARQLGVETHRIALVGDTLHDLDCARAAGAIAVAVLSGPAGREELEPHADHVIADIGELPSLAAAL